MQSNKNCGSFMEEKKLLGVNQIQPARAASTSNLLVPDMNSWVENTYNSKSGVSQCGSIRIDKNNNDFNLEEFES